MMDDVEGAEDPSLGSERGLESDVEVRVDGHVAMMASGAGWSLTEIVGAIRIWAERAGSTICSLALDGRDVTSQELARQEGEAPALLEIRTLDRTRVRAYTLHRVAGLLPTLRMDLASASQTLGADPTRGGLEALYRAVSALGSLEAALSALGMTPPGEQDDPEFGSALGKLQELLRDIHGAVRAGDLTAMAARFGEEGPSLIDEWSRIVRRLVPDSAPPE